MILCCKHCGNCRESNHLAENCDYCGNEMVQLLSDEELSQIVPTAIRIMTKNCGTVVQKKKKYNGQKTKNRIWIIVKKPTW